ncbi:MAG: hypothetical protein K6U09_11320 [Acidobacteriia bacterium]|nr:hypothetical protein [Terriglobia bacterium]
MKTAVAANLSAQLPFFLDLLVGISVAGPQQAKEVLVLERQLVGVGGRKAVTAATGNDLNRVTALKATDASPHRRIAAQPREPAQPGVGKCDRAGFISESVQDFQQACFCSAQLPPQARAHNRFQPVATRSYTGVRISR